MIESFKLASYNMTLCGLRTGQEFLYTLLLYNQIIVLQNIGS